jgi:hypothetical protein
VHPLKCTEQIWSSGCYQAPPNGQSAGLDCPTRRLFEIAQKLCQYSVRDHDVRRPEWALGEVRRGQTRRFCNVQKSSALTARRDLFYFSHVPSPGVPGGPQRPKNGQTQNPPLCLVVNSLSCPELEMIEFGRRDAAIKNSAPETNSKKYIAQSSTSLTLTLDLLISDAAIDQTITGSRAPKINI